MIGSPAQRIASYTVAGLCLLVAPLYLYLAVVPFARHPQVAHLPFWKYAAAMLIGGLPVLLSVPLLAATWLAQKEERKGMDLASVILTVLCVLLVLLPPPILFALGATR